MALSRALFQLAGNECCGSLWLYRLGSQQVGWGRCYPSMKEMERSILTGMQGGVREVLFLLNLCNS